MESTSVVQVVVHFLDGTMFKGATRNTNPGEGVFRVCDNESGEMVRVELSELKAMFFVRTHKGNQDYQERFDIEKVGHGRKIRVHFKDGEVMEAYALGYHKNKPFFYMFPPDPESNNEKILVARSATTNIEFI